MDKLNQEWLSGKLNFYFRYKRFLLESKVEGACLNVGCGSHLITGATNIDEGLPRLPYADESFDTVVCSDVLEHIGPHRQALAELLRVARKKVIITVPAYKWLLSEYDDLVGHKRRYVAKDFTGFHTQYLFWHCVPLLFLRKILRLKHRMLPTWVEELFYQISKIHFNFGTTLLAEKRKIPMRLKTDIKISYFIPIFNEANIIRREIKALQYVLRRLPYQSEIFIINDSSPERTLEISDQIAKGNQTIKLLNYPLGPTRRENLGKSFFEATGDIVLFFDMDMVASLRFIPDLIDGILEGNDLVIGSRYMPNGQVKRKWYKWLVSRPVNLIASWIFNTKVKDHFSGFKAFRVDVIKDLMGGMGYDESLTRGSFWDVELLLRAKNKNYRIKEIPIWWKEKKKSGLNFKREWLAFVYMIRFMLR